MAEGLRVTCDGSHSHKHIIGLSGGRNRSEQAARYPNRLVDSILELYQKSTQHSHIHVLSLEELLDECHGADHLMQQIEADVADQPLVQDLQAVEEEQLPLPLESGDNPAESPGEVRSLPLEESMSLGNLVRRAVLKPSKLPRNWFVLCVFSTKGLMGLEREHHQEIWTPTKLLVLTLCGCRGTTNLGS